MTCAACCGVKIAVGTSTPRRRSSRNTRVSSGTSSPIASSSCACENISAGVPLIATRPSFITTRRLTFAATSSMEWLTIMTVAFCAA